MTSSDPTTTSPDATRHEREALAGALDALADAVAAAHAHLRSASPSHDEYAHQEDG